MNQTVDEVLRSARQQLGAGNASGARSVLRRALEHAPQSTPLWLLLGQTEFSARRFAAAREALMQADQLLPDQPRTKFFLGVCERELGDFDTALVYLKRAALALPPIPDAYSQLGATLALSGHLDEAAAAFKSELRHFPANARAHNNLGDCLRKVGKHDEAVLAFERAVGLNPHFALAWRNLGDCLHSQRQFDAAIAAWQTSIRLQPTDYQAQESLGMLYLHLHALEPACAHLSRACELAPITTDNFEHAPIHCALAYALAKLNKWQAARDVARRVLDVDGQNIQAAILANCALPCVNDDTEMIAHARLQFSNGLKHLHEHHADWPSDRSPAAIWGLVSDNFLLAYHGEDDREFQQAYADWLRRIARALTVGEYRRHSADGAASAKIRVAFLSTHVYDCTVGKYFERWMTGLAHRAEFEIHVFYHGTAVDSLTERVASACSLHYVGGNIEHLVREVIDQRFDAVIYPEIGMGSTGYLLANLRLAPLQCVAWGHPVTTGSSEIDVFFTASAMEPADGDSHYREQLVGLPGIGTSYRKPVLPSDLSRSQLGLPEHGRLLLCGQSLFKIHPDCDALFVEVLSMVRTSSAHARLVLFEDLAAPTTQAFKSRFSSALAKRGLNWDECVCMQPRGDHERFLAVNRVCDVMLDTLHWSGGNTSIDAIVAGLPIVTLPGRFMRGRQSAAMLKQIGLERLVVASKAEYVALVLKLCTDDAFMQRVRGDLAQYESRGYKLFDDDAPIHALADYLKQTVQRLRDNALDVADIAR
jgi:protein O-GlcNAc transferase